MATDSLPLLELFTRLRDSGMPLGIDEYQLALKAMSKGFGVGDRAALLRLCETLWTKTEEERQRLAYHFEQLMPPRIDSDVESQMPLQPSRQFLSPAYIALAVGLVVGVGAAAMVWVYRDKPVPAAPTAQTPPAETSLPPSPAPPQSSEIEEVPKETIKPPMLEEETRWIWLIFIGIIALTTGLLLITWLSQWLLKRSPSKAPKLSSDKFSKGTQAIHDEIEAARAQQRSTNRARFSAGGQYLPITQRRMKQSWRYLSRPVREGVPTELDVEATIQRIGQQGSALEPVLVPPRTNRAALMILVDQDGSMTPFHKLTERLVTTAQRGGRFGMTHVYYFHNCPVGCLYRDAICLEDAPLDEIFDQLPMERLSTLIVSDAGAARQGYNSYRCQETQAFLDVLFQRVRHAAWLNPLPKERWSGTTAAEVAQMIPMFGCNRAGLDEAIEVLRGRKTRAELKA